MDFTLTERETWFRDRVKAFIDAEIRPQLASLASPEFAERLSLMRDRIRSRP